MNYLQPITSIASMRGVCAQLQSSGTIALVPTMGALHEGHLSLVRAAKKLCNAVVVSIFVNPLQFAPTEDFTRYPRPLETDMALLEKEGVALVFAPSVDEIYPRGNTGTFVEVPGIGDRLDGKFRPGHFRGVATVVAKLFHIISPDIALFGQKDAAQIAVLKAMVRDLNFPSRLVVCPTVRETDGLAMSSRNKYLSSIERTQALVLYRALNAAQQAAHQGILDAGILRHILLQQIEAKPAVRIEYAEVVDPDSLFPVADVSEGALLAVAALVGQTRLIDNLLLPSSPGSNTQ